MKITVNERALKNLDYDPATDADESAQCVLALAMTPQGTVPLERGLGMPMRYLHRPLPAAKATFESELIEQMDAWDTGAVLTGATYSVGVRDGQLNPTLEVELNG